MKIRKADRKGSWKRDAHDGLGRKPVLEWLPVGKLSVDPKYQRDTASRRSRNMIEKIAAGFRWERFGVLLVVKSGGGSSRAERMKALWCVIDGQHRVEAARLKGIDLVPCVVLPHATVEEAAADFVAINRDRVTVTALSIHAAMVTARDPSALDVEAACREAGAIVCKYPIPANKLKPGQTLAVGEITRIVKCHGRDAAAKVLRRVVRTYGRTPGAINARAIRETAKMLGFGRTAAAALQKGAKVRDCLSCGNPFLSENNGNRRCSGCKETDAVAA